MMKRLVMMCGLMWLYSAGAQSSGVAAAASGDHWLMMVTTQNTDPAREAEFNDWYDNIDIPDVLEVPGYERARRGVEQRLPGDAPREGPINYVALYDIRSAAIDKTIIDMLMASWGMEKSHHSTDLLKVTERVYFQRYGAPHRAPAGDVSKKNRYIYVARFDCCRDAPHRHRFDRWYDDKYVPRLFAHNISNVTRYRLYRVLMDKPVAIPEYMSIYEVAADSAAEASQDISAVRAELGAADRSNESIVAAAHTHFLQIKGVPRP